MAGLCVKMLKLLLFICSYILSVLTNNIDIEVSPILKHGTSGSYFGFSATGVNNGTGRWVAVGSPTANSTKYILLNIKKPIERSGALYNCPISMDRNDCSDITVPMFKIRQSRLFTLYPQNGWYGVSVAGGRENEQVLVCSHRLTIKYCNSASQCKTGLPGGCKKITGSFAEKSGGIFVIHTNNKGDISGGSINDDRQIAYTGSLFGQTGINSISAKYKTDDVFSGAVGDQSWTGAVVGKVQEFVASTEKYAYGGYSLAHGDFFTVGKSAFAFGAPRYQLKGAIFVHKTMDNITSAIIIKGPQDGSYFGMSMCADDFNGDKISEIVVAAPYYTESLSEPAIGIVYVYSNKNNFKKPIHVLKAEKSEAHALFGRCVASVGDLDHDGFNDLGVGVPYEDNGGAVYIYQGSRNGLYTVPVQIIRASYLPYQLKTFGWSVRGHVDLDKNGYPDLVVGAYASDSIVILRSVPVVDVTSSYVLTPTSIDVSNRNCTVSIPNHGDIKTVCFAVEIFSFYEDRAKMMKKDIDLAFTLEADTLVKDQKKRRVAFQQTHSSVLEISNGMVQNGKRSKIVKAMAYLRTDLCPDCEDKISPFPDIQLNLTPKLPKRAKPPAPATSGPPPSLENYFQLPFYTQRVDFHNTTTTMLSVKRACDPCKPNLKITNIGTTTISVKAQSVHLKVKISNTEERAYVVVFKMFLPPKLTVAPCVIFEGLKCLSDCPLGKNKTEMTCDLGSIFDKPKEFAIKLNTSLASQSLDIYKVLMNVSSGNVEEAKLLGDNTLELELLVESKADIGVRQSGSTESRYYGGSVRGQFSMDRVEQIGLTVEHRYVVENKGPDIVPEVNITIEWPYAAESGKHLLYLLDIKADSRMTCFPDPDWVNPLAKQFKQLKKEVLKTTSKRKRRNVGDGATDKITSAAINEQLRKGSSSKVILDCRNHTARCHPILCSVKDLDAQENVAVTFKSRIWNGTLLEDYKGRDVVVVSHARVDNVTGYVTDLDQTNHNAEASTSFFPASPKTTKKGIAVWIIVVSAIAGVILLVILIAVFKMCGFFNRMDTSRYDSVPAS